MLMTVNVGAGFIPLYISRRMDYNMINDQPSKENKDDVNKKTSKR